jgi:hypothetical protein
MQIAALKTGLESVVSRHVLSLMTWTEIEHRICGSPEITIEDLKMSSMLILALKLFSQLLKLKLFISKCSKNFKLNTICVLIPIV